MKIFKIDLVFENCEVISIDVYEHETSFNASNIVENIHCHGQDEYRMKVADMVQVCVGYSSLSLKSQIGTTLQEKLSHNDITSIVLIYEDKSEEQIYVPWDEDQQNSDFENSYQYNEFLDDLVVININKK